ncbi:MAG: hypothetical protein QM817_41765 [Archangium sp.]
MTNTEKQKRQWQAPVVRSEPAQSGISFACSSTGVDGCVRGQYFCSEVSDCIPCQDPCEPI